MKKSDKNLTLATPKPGLSDEARLDLKKIQSYLTEEKESPQTALKVIEKILVKIESLINLPNRGTLLSPKVNFPTNYRYIREAGYLIFLPL